MDEMKNVLLVTNSVSEEEVSLIQEAMMNSTSKALNISLSLVHVIPNLPTCYFNIPSMVALTEQYYQEAKKSLTTIGDALKVTKKNQWLITGRIKNEVMRLAGKLDTQFILASSSNLQDFHKSNTPKKLITPTDIRNVSNIGVL